MTRTNQQKNYQTQTLNAKRTLTRTQTETHAETQQETQTETQTETPTETQTETQRPERKHKRILNHTHGKKVCMQLWSDLSPQLAMHEARIICVGGLPIGQLLNMQEFEFTHSQSAILGIDKHGRSGDPSRPPAAKANQDNESFLNATGSGEPAQTKTSGTPIEHVPNFAYTHHGCLAWLNEKD